ASGLGRAASSSSSSWKAFPLRRTALPPLSSVRVPASNRHSPNSSRIVTTTVPSNESGQPSSQNFLRTLPDRRQVFPGARRDRSHGTLTRQKRIDPVERVDPTLNQLPRTHQRG